MTATEAMEKIEGLRFSALTNFASDLRTFIDNLVSQPEVKALGEAMASEDATLAVFLRSLELAEIQRDEAYEHPADAALAAYLWLLSARERSFSEIVAGLVIDCQQCWWARKVAGLVSDVSRFLSGAASKSRVVNEGGVDVDYTTHATNNIVPIHTLTQKQGRFKRIEPRAAREDFVVYMIRQNDWPNYFKNQGTRDRIAVVLPGRG
jgi:hypothetical protein